MDDLSKRLLARVTESVVLEYVRELVRRPSVNPPGDYDAVTAYVHDEMKKLGIELQTTECHPGRKNLVGRVRGTGGGSALCLASHFDVVNIGEAAAWQRDPFGGEVADGAMWGRGTADSKGMLAGMLVAVRAFKEANLRPRGDLYLVAYPDDETAGPCGLRDAYRHGLVEADHLVLGEATAFEIQHMFKARLWFSIDVVGRSSHGAFPERGINAIYKAFSVIQAIRGISLLPHAKLGADTVSVGMIKGGEQVNVVAGRCRVWFDIRWAPPRTSKDILNEVRTALEKLKASDPELQLTDPEVSEERDPLDFPEESPLNAAIKTAGRKVLGREIGLGGWYSSGELWPVWTQGKIRYGAVIGPGKPWAAHAYDEHVPVDELVDSARIYALTALNVCGAE